LRKKESSEKIEFNPQPSNNQISLQSMMCASSVLSGNPEVYSNLFQNENISDEEEDKLSIEGEMA
jgi:hypothetical protein